MFSPFFGPIYSWYWKCLNFHNRKAILIIFQKGDPEQQNRKRKKENRFGPQNPPPPLSQKIGLSYTPPLCCGVTDILPAALLGHTCRAIRKPVLGTPRLWSSSWALRRKVEKQQVRKGQGFSPTFWVARRGVCPFLFYLTLFNCCSFDGSRLGKRSKLVDRSLLIIIWQPQNSPKYFKYVNDPQFNLYSYPACINL